MTRRSIHHKGRGPGICASCKTYVDYLEQDHIIPKWKGGTDDPYNLQLLCDSCHRKKNGTDIAELHRGIPESEEAKRKISESQRGKIISAETKDRMRQAAIGRKYSATTKEKHRKLTTRQWENPESRSVIEATRKTTEYREAARQRRLGKKTSPETRKKISDAVKRQRMIKEIL